MNEFFNFHNTYILFQHNWLWFVVAFALGVYVGLTTNVPNRSTQRQG
jgi:hypothetical protein